MSRKFTHERVLRIVPNTLYITSGILILIMFFSNVQAESREIDSYSGATEMLDCMNCDEID